ncbi:type VII secretion integral membrane protein EccD [Actinacidiphila rubida]|uniref:Type VII secretion integral membrane protein EccD n=1 Tax=Actinacidiphila rubida TaxID=310780 RepID=A0A1H8RZG3_9ACTN|nr:type VII secretion integral membrane protein EccD [Actinacidiphila rubida]SEO71594.1 type VII secretion integral membrane protein EccD [Actinacidiphila rubida]
MENERCHVTVVGARRRVDLAVPADAAIAEYTPALLTLLGEVEFDDTLPPVWSLALPGGPPFGPQASLRECGVVDGATLYLRDAATGEFDEPVVTDLEEKVEEAGEEVSVWGRRTRAYTTLVLGVLGMIAGFVALGATGGRSTVLPAAAGAAVLVAFSLLALVWQATRQGWSLPLGLRLVMACAAVPLLAVAAASLPPATSGDGPHAGAVLVALCAGAVLGALAALLAVRHATTLMAAAMAGFALVLTVCLTAGHASLLESAAVVGVALLAVLGVAPRLSGHFAVLAGHSGGADGRRGEADVSHLVRRGRRLLVGTNVVVSVVATACLLVLGSAHQRYAVALAACLGLAFVLRAGRLTVASAVVPVVLAGATGLTATLLTAPGTFGAPDWTGATVLVAAAVLALAVGLVRAFRTDAPDVRPAWIDPFAGFLTVVCVPLVVGVFGVYGAMMNSGHTP